VRVVSGGTGVAAVILAAGFSRRLGRPKQTLEIGGETLVERAVRLAGEAGLSPVCVVVADAAVVEGLVAMVVVNGEAEEGMASSIRCGVARAAELQGAGIVLMTSDQVALRAEHLRLLVEDESRMTGSRYAGRVGIPAYFPAASFEDLLRLRGDVGARDLLREAHSVVAEELSLDVDTEQDLERARTVVERL
jgi:molybdenum cofactor cytidylyltransferase